MTNETENFIHAYFRRIDGMFQELKHDMADVKSRLSSLELSVVSFRRDKVSDAEAVAHLHARVDRVQDDIDRIKRRLELMD